MDERTALYLLNSSEELWINTITEMRVFAGSYAKALEAPEADYRRAGILKTDKKVEALRYIRRERNRLLEELADYEEKGIRVVTHLDDAFPERLKNIPDAPLLLYVRGELPEDKQPAVSMIGARDCSDYGIEVAEYFSEELARKGIRVISGLASGIDSAAAEGAIRGGGKTYAVLGTGVSVCYPRESYHLFEKLSRGSGGILSEFSPKAPPLKQHFVMRNRLIAGLGDVLMVIEARERSGTSITVGYALNQGKDVFALPGRITDPLGYGCNRLLKEGAIPLTSPSDVLEYFGMEEDGQLKIGWKDESALEEKERAVFRHVSEDPMHVEDIAAFAGLPLRETLAVLHKLELKSYVRNTNSAYYRRCR